MWNFWEEWLFGIDQKQDIEKFEKKHPIIEIRQIVEKIEKFNQVVQGRDLEKLEQSALIFDEDLKKDIRRAVVLSNFLRKYSFYSIFPLNNYISILQNDDVKVDMRYRKRRLKSKKYFSYYITFRRFEGDWLIVETNLLYKLQWREWIILFFWLLVPLLLFFYSIKLIIVDDVSSHLLELL